jgi:ubiquinone/menaquinone biosynthesis C-methylase UbiE
MKQVKAAQIWTPRLYNRLAPLYDRLFDRLFALAALARERVAAGLRQGTVLDVGCGTGTLLALAGARGMQCFGIDTSAGMLGQAKRKMPGAHLCQASFYAIPYRDRSFDAVVETNALSGVGINVVRVLREMLRVCRPGGQVRIADYAQPAEERWIHPPLRYLGALFGDYPWDYQRLFRELGHDSRTEILDGYGMYQLVTVST